jgi:NTP pyrophosphatase (non-canonical NTP hydrolase)
MINISDKGKTMTDRIQQSAVCAPDITDLDVLVEIAGAGSSLVLTCHSLAARAGWYHDPKTGALKDRNVGEMLMLIVSEVSEAMEGHRKNLKDDKLKHRSMIEVELADAVIRICDLAGYLDLDLGGAIAEKLAFNAVREDHKPENRAKEGGKAY